jgi:glycosyltransferase involved in cell wall biosynthesis
MGMREGNAIHGLWIGKELSKLEQLTIRSFARQGHPFNLWVYDDLEGDLPDGVVLQDAAKILPRERIFLKERPDPGSSVGQKSYGPFSDLFRYKLLYDQGGTWADMDLTCLKAFDFEEPYLFRSHRIGVMGNLLKAPKGSELMWRTFEMADAIADENVPWLALNRLLTRNVHELGLDNYVRTGIVNEGDAADVIKTYAASPFQRPPQSWYAIHWANEFWGTRASPGGPSGGFPTKDAPVSGSLLHELYRAHGLIDAREEVGARIYSGPKPATKSEAETRADTRSRSINMLLPTLNRGGAERIALDVASALCDDPNIHVHLYVRKTSKRTHARSVRDNLHVVFLDEPGAPTLIEIAQAMVRRGNPVIFTHLIPPEQLRKLWAAGLLTVPVIHNAKQGWNEDPAALDEANVPFMIACCDAVREELLAVGCKPPVVTIRHEVTWSPRPHALVKARQSIRDRWGIEDDMLLIGMIGQFKSQKAYPRAIRVLAEIQNRGIPAKLMIVGGWDHSYGWGRKTFEATMRLAVDRGVVADVILTGETDAPVDYLASFDVFLNTSVFEGLSISMMEAMACGCPMVVSDVGGIREIATGDAALIEHGSEIAAYCDAILELAQRETRLIPPPQASPELIPQIWLGLNNVATSVGIAPRPAPNGTLFVIDGLHLGGPAVSLCRLLEARTRNHRVGVMTLHGVSVEGMAEAVTRSEAELFSAQAGISPTRAAHHIVKILLERNFGSVCFWSAPAEVKLMVAKLLEPTAIQLIDVSPGPMMFDELKQSAEFQRRIAFTDDQYLARLNRFVSLYKEGTPEHYGKRCEHTHVIALGVPPPPPFIPLPPPELLPPAWFDPAFAIGTVSRLVPYKKIELLLDAMAILNVELPQANLTIIGAPDATSTAYADELYQRASELRLSNVHFVGAYGDINRFLSMWRVFVLSGERQGCPNASLEAMAMGLPVIAVDSGGVREQIVNGKTGYVVRSANELASRIKSVLNDPKHLARLSQQSRHRARSRFDLADSAKRFAEVLAI